MRLGLFGGSFNPPHVGHLAVAEACAEALDLDRVVWMPAATPPHKQGDATLASGADRLALVEAAIAGNDRFAASAHEVDRGDVSYTVDTLRHLTQAHPEAAWYLIVGGDSLAGFASWREPREILRLARLGAYARPEADLGDVPSWVTERTTRVEGPLLDLSSTQLRARLGAGRTVRYLVPEAVRREIHERRLYGTEVGGGA